MKLQVSDSLADPIAGDVAPSATAAEGITNVVLWLYVELPVLVSNRPYAESTLRGATEFVHPMF